MMNILNGGAHADSNVDIQEFMIAPSAPTPSARRCAWAPGLRRPQGVLKAKGLLDGPGDEGGFAPNLESNRAALDLILEAIKAAIRARQGRLPRADVAASEFEKDGKYTFEGKELSADDMIAIYSEWVDALPAGLDRGSAERRGLGRLEVDYRPARQQGPAGRRRPVRHEPVRLKRGIESGTANAAGQGQPDRHTDRDDRRRRHGPPRRLQVHDVAPLR